MAEVGKQVRWRGNDATDQVDDVRSQADDEVRDTMSDGTDGEPRAPVAVAIRLVANGLRPQEVAGIVNDVRRRPDEVPDDAA